MGPPVAVSFLRSWRRPPADRYFHRAACDRAVAEQVRDEVSRESSVTTRACLIARALVCGCVCQTSSEGGRILSFTTRSFTLGCGCLVAGMTVLKGWRTQLNAMMQPDRLPFSAGAPPLTQVNPFSASAITAQEQAASATSSVRAHSQGTWGARSRRSGQRRRCTPTCYPSSSQGFR